MVEFIMEFDDAIYDEKTGMSVFKPRVVGELIRCKDCKFWEKARAYDFDANLHYCSLVDGGCRDDFYCADAERRTDA